MTIEFRLNEFNSSHAKSFYKVLSWYGLIYEKSTENNTRIIKFDKDFERSKTFIEFCQEISEKFTERKMQNFGRFGTNNIVSVDIAINTISEPYLAVFTLYVTKTQL